MVRGERVLASSEHGAGRGVLVGVGAVIGGGVALRSGFLVVFVEVEVVGLGGCGQSSFGCMVGYHRVPVLL